MSRAFDEHRIVNSEATTSDWRGVIGQRDAVALLALLGTGLVIRVQLPLAPSIEVALLLIALGAAVVSPLAAVTIAILALPFAYETVVLLEHKLSMLEIAIIVAVTGTALAAVFALRHAGGRHRLRQSAQPWWLSASAIIFLVAGTASLWVTGIEHLDENLRVYRWTIAEPVSFWAACAWTLQRHRERWFIAGAFVVVGAVTGMAAVVEAVFGPGGMAGGSVNRPQLDFPHPNNLAFLLERTAAFAVGLSLTARQSLWWKAGAFLALGGVFATFSRGAYLAVAIAVVWLVGSRHRQGRTIVAGTAVAVAAIGALWIGGRLFDPGGGGEVPTRLAIWRSSARMLADHLLTGVGLDGFLYDYWRRYVEPSGWPERYTSHPHNLPLDVWLRLGILGILAFAAVTGAYVLAVGRQRLVRPHSAPLMAASTAALLAGIGHGLVDNGYFLPDLAAMTWFFIALSTGAAAGVQPEPS